MARSSGNKRTCAVLFLIAFVLAFSVTMAIDRVLLKPRGVLSKIAYSSVVIDLPSGKYRIAPALAHIEQHETLSELADRLKPYAAITGTYYGPDCSPLGDILVDGKLVHRGFQRQGIGFTRDGGIRFFERRGSSRIKWRGCYAGIACGPRLLRNGKIGINVCRDGFTEAAASKKATRCAAGATKDGKLVLIAVTQPVTLNTLAQAMLELGAVNAINLDGGALCGLYANGECRVTPIRPVSNVLAVYKIK